MKAKMTIVENINTFRVEKFNRAKLTDRRLKLIIYIFFLLKWTRDMYGQQIGKLNMLRLLVT